MLDLMDGLITQILRDINIVESGLRKYLWVDGCHCKYFD